MSTLATCTRLGRALWGANQQVKVWYSWGGGISCPDGGTPVTPTSGGTCTAKIARFTTQGACVPTDADGTATLSSAAVAFATDGPIYQRTESAKVAALESLAGVLIAALQAANIPIPQFG